MTIEEFLTQAFTEDQDARMANQYEKYEEISKRHVATLRPWLETHKWTLEGKVEMYAWTLIQHADHDVEFQEYCLHLMRKRSSRQDLIAYLTDRTLVNRNLPQLYGTQLYLDEVTKEYHPYDIRLPLTVDIRRKAVSLNPLSEYIAGMYEFNWLWSQDQ
jgi:hypothetical protein